MKKYTINTTFMASEEEATLLEKSANDRRCSKGYILRELIRENLATQKSPEAA